MSVRSLAILAVGCATLAACGTGSGILAVAGSSDAATVRFVNATTTPLDLVTGGSVNAGNANIVGGGGVGCFAVPDPTVAQLAVRQSGATTDLTSFPSTFSAGGRYTLVAYPTLAGGIQVVSIPNASALVTGRSALRVFHASPNLGQADLYVTAPGAALDVPRITGLGFGASTGSLDVAAGPMQIRLTSTGTTTVVFDAGSQALQAGTSYTLIVPATGAAILVPDC